MLKKFILAVLLLLSLLTGCGSGLTPEEVIDRAINAIDELQTYRFEMTGMMTVDGEISQGNMQGEFVSPDRVHMISVSNDITEEGIRIGTTEYVRQSDGDSWEVREWPSTMASATNNPAVSTVMILDSLVGLVELRDEEIDGVSCFHYRGNIDAEAMVEEQIANLDPSQPYYEEMVRSIVQQLQSENDVEFWIGKEDYLLRQVEVHQDMVYGEDLSENTESQVHITSITTCRLFDFNQPITIELPVVE